MTVYPPLRALVAFDEVVRRNSIKLAAEALHVTPGAVGQQIKKLESWLGIALLVRDVRRITVTPEGMNYHRQIAPLLGQIAQVSQAVRHPQKRQIRLSMPPGLAAKWFSPRLGDFIRAFPQYDLHLNATTSYVDLAAGEADMLIRHFDGDSKQFFTRLLVNDDSSVFASPRYIEAKQLRCAEDLQRATLLHSTLHPWWPVWLRINSSLSDGDISEISGIHFDQTLLAIEAAKAGQGVMITDPLLLESELAQGELVQLFTARAPSHKGYYLLMNKAQAGERHLIAIADWLTGQIPRKGKDYT